MQKNMIFLALLCATVLMFSGAVAAADVPSANFTSNVTSGTAPLSVQFNDTSNNTPTSWSWDFGDGNTSTEQNPRHTYTKTGKYTVKLTAFNENGNNTVTKTNFIDVLDTIGVGVNVPGGWYNHNQTIVLNATANGTKIYYTTNGSVPTTSSTLYTGPITIVNTTTLKYMAVDDANNTSQVYTQVYTIDTVAPVVTVVPKSGSYVSPLRVVFYANEWAVVYYTLDGTDPTTRGILYNGSLVLGTSKTLKYVGVDFAGNVAPVVTEKYKIYKATKYRSTVKVRYKGWYKAYYYKTYKHWYRSHGKLKCSVTRKLAYKWKYGWTYRYMTKTGTKYVLT